MDVNTVNKTCRVCLRSNLRKCKGLLEKFMTSTISSHITSLVQFQISEDHKFPEKICLPCFKQLQTAIEFKNKCETSHAILLASLTVKKEEETLKSEESSEELTKTEQFNNRLEDNECSEDLQDNLFEDIQDESILTEVKIKETVRSEKTFKSEESIEQLTKIEKLEFYLEDNYLREDLERFTTDDIQVESSIKEAEANIAVSSEELRPSRAIDLNLECHDCGEIFRSKCKLKVHWNKVHLPEALTCTVCKKKCGTFKSLNLHSKSKICAVIGKARIEGVGKNKEYHCKECSYKTKSRQIWKTHYVIHTGERSFVCGMCGKCYTQLSGLHQHKESAHQLYKAEGACHVCGKYIKGKAKMRDHLAIHRQRGVRCEICGKTLKNKYSLADHMTLHTGIKPYTCEVCAHTAYSSASLANHQRKKHSEEKECYDCDLCAYKCNRKARLKQHRAGHTATSMPCTVCGRFYECKKELTKHQAQHSAERNFACNFCNKAYLNTIGLGKHIRKYHKLKQGDPAVQLLRIKNKMGKECAKEKRTDGNILTDKIE